MKKNIIIFFIFFIFVQVYCWEFYNLPPYYSQYYDEMSNKNILSHNADILEKKFNIKVYIYKYRGNLNLQTDEITQKYFNKIIEKDNNKKLFIWFSKKRDNGVILISDDLNSEIDEKYLKLLQNDVLRSLLSRWYISESRVLGKVLGGIIYLLDKNNLDKKQIEKLKTDIIIVDDPLYLLSRKPFFSELIDLFEFEPVSFFFYFPFVTYFVFVRIIGIRFKITGFIVSNIIWGFFVIFIFYLIFHRIDIFFHEYMKLFYLFVGLNIPLYFYLTNLYANEIQAAAYGYFYNISGGFDTKNVFEGRQWEKKK